MENVHPVRDRENVCGAVHGSLLVVFRDRRRLGVQRNGKYSVLDERKMIVKIGNLLSKLQSPQASGSSPLFMRIALLSYLRIPSPVLNVTRCWRLVLFSASRQMSNSFDRSHLVQNAGTPRDHPACVSGATCGSEALRSPAH